MWQAGGIDTLLDSIAPHIRLVVADMDGTFLDADQHIPDGSRDLIQRLKDAGIIFCPASGRQYGRLAAMFDGHSDGMPFIADNGTLIMRDGEELGSTTLPRETVVEAVKKVRSAGEDGILGVVLSGKEASYIETEKAPFTEECHKYYSGVKVVDDLLGVDDEIMKVACFDYERAADRLYPLMSGLNSQVVLSAWHWVDVMPEGANKGLATKTLQSRLGISPDETIAFGDYHNDLEMLQSAGTAVAMAGAQQEIKDIADIIAPGNDEHGVHQILEKILDRRLKSS